MAKKKKKISKTDWAIIEVCFLATLALFAAWGFIAFCQLLYELAI